MTLGTMASQWDPNTRATVVGASGEVARVHWVDQAVALAICVTKGSLKGASDVGSTYHEMRVLEPRTVQADVEERTRAALSRLLAAPAKVELLKVESDASVRGQLRIAVSYRNLLTGAVRTTSTTTSAR